MWEWLYININIPYNGIFVAFKENEEEHPKY